MIYLCNEWRVDASMLARHKSRGTAQVGLVVLFPRIKRFMGTDEEYVTAMLYSSIFAAAIMLPSAAIGAIPTLLCILCMKFATAKR
jgi:predicted membrane protein